MTKQTVAKPAARRQRAPAGGMTRPHDAPVLRPEPDAERAAEQPFAEGAHDAIDSDLRHRMISEAAYRRYAERGYADGYDVDDWLQAEADVDHVLLAGTP
jgi:hypothetical protein